MPHAACHMSEPERGPFLAWQWRTYADNHRDRRNLILHLVTVPIFIAGLASVVIGAVTLAPWTALGGAAGMLVAVASQGRGHRLEAVAPQPFRGPGDVIVRLFMEQLVTFPRYVLTGGVARAWRGER